MTPQELLHLGFCYFNPRAVSYPNILMACGTRRMSFSHPGPFRSVEPLLGELKRIDCGKGYALVLRPLPAWWLPSADVIVTIPGQSYRFIPSSEQEVSV